MFGEPRPGKALFNPADLSSLPVLRACTAGGIAFVPFFSLGAGGRQSNAVLGDPRVTRAAERLGVTPAQIALAWALDLAPNLLVIPGTASRVHLAENIAAQQVELDEQARRELSVALYAVSPLGPTCRSRRRCRSRRATRERSRQLGSFEL